MNSLDPTCNPSKHRYDTCFNRWFESYLSVADSPSSPGPGPGPAAKKEEALRAKVDEYERDCGPSWREYEGCVKKALKEKDILPLLSEARKSEPMIKPEDVKFPPPEGEAPPR